MKNRVFIVGCPRSGTTLLQGVLAAHPSIFSLPETFFFASVHTRSLLKRHLLWPSIKARGRLKSILFEMGRGDLAEKYKISIIQRDYYIPFIDAMDYMTFESGKSVWVEKTPWHLKCIDEILRCVPDAKFIHILRNGADVVSSLHRATNTFPEKWARLKTFRTFKGFTIKQCVDRWNEDIQKSLLYTHDGNHLLVYYDELKSNPEIVSKKMCHFLDLEFNHDMLSPQNSFTKITAPNEPWKANNEKGILPHTLIPLSQFSHNELKYIKDHLFNFPKL